ncbi:hypothetical protein [Flagellimonas flava]|uniref:hypothetical protein n=1 Tax=Flagellimonas flava TaxID=570519 RepID=UPI003D6499AC
MFLEQLQLFPTKESFDSADFENPNNPEFFRSITSSVFEAFELFSKDNKPFYDKTSKSNMLNNAISHIIKRNCSSANFEFVESLSNTRRSLAILDKKYVIMFKKAPVSNVKTNQDDQIKYQELDKHVIFLTYEVDDFWSEIKKVEFRYYSTPKNITYIYDVTNLVESPTTRIIEPMEVIPPITIKEDAKKERKKSL